MAGAEAGTRERWLGAIAVVASCLALPATAQTRSAAEPTPAGTPIVNVAAATYAIDGVAHEAQSNAVTLIVAERLDVGLARGNDAVPQIAAEPVGIPVVLTNRGSGEEAFALVAQSSTPSATVRGIAIDRNGDGRFDANSDTVVGTTPPLAPGEMLPLIVMVAAAGDGGAADGTVTLTARAATGSGRTDEVFPGQGDGGADAVVGPTGAAAAVEAPFVGVPPAPTLMKVQSVRAPDGSADPVSGAVVTYTLTARFPAAPTRAARIDDPLPAGTIYLPGTLSLDGRALTDADDGDVGRVADRRVTVALGEPAPGSAHAIRFQIRLP